RLDRSVISSGVLTTLDVRPQIGRAFTSDDDRDGAPGVILLSKALWVNMFGGDPNVIGHTIRLDDQPYTIIGVMPEGFAFPTRTAQLWTCLRFTISTQSPRGDRSLNVVARLRPGVSPGQARADMSLVAGQLARSYPKDNQDVGANVFAMRD